MLPPSDKSAAPAWEAGLQSSWKVHGEPTRCRQSGNGPTLRLRVSRRLRRFQPPQVDRERRAPALAIARAFYAAAVHLHQALHNREPNTDTAAGMLEGFLALDERVEDMGQ